MKKKITAVLTGIAMTMLMMTPVFAASESFTLGNVGGTVSLSKSSTSATGKTAYGVNRSVTATRTVQVSLKCKKSGRTYTYTDSAVAATNSANYNSHTASVTVYRPSSGYTVTGASSSHKVTISAGSFTRNLYA